ncbi:hypothetical protein PLANTIT3_50308 [Plantibacter sp. T3]|nr:hypothetical protein PLANTIT3_50308 [Plantibacter sp. T3]
MTDSASVRVRLLEHVRLVRRVLIRRLVRDLGGRRADHHVRVGTQCVCSGEVAHVAPASCGGGFDVVLVSVCRWSGDDDVQSARDLDLLEHLGGHALVDRRLELGVEREDDRLLGRHGDRLRRLEAPAVELQSERPFAEHAREDHPFQLGERLIVDLRSERTEAEESHRQPLSQVCHASAGRSGRRGHCADGPGSGQCACASGSSHRIVDNRARAKNVSYPERALHRPGPRREAHSRRPLESTAISGVGSRGFPWDNWSTALATRVCVSTTARSLTSRRSHS